MTRIDEDEMQRDLLGLDPAIVHDPHRLYRDLRERAPVYREPRYGVFLVSRYADVVRVVRDTATFSSVCAPSGPGPDLSDVPTDIVDRYVNAPAPIRTLVTADAPDHSRYRMLTQRFLNSRRVATLEGSMRSIADELVDGFIDRGGCDFVAEFAGPLPLIVVANLLGMPRDDRGEFGRWAERAAHGIGNPHVAGQQLAERRTSDFGPTFESYFRSRIGGCRSRPPVEGDFVSEITHATDDDGAGLNDDEVLSIVGHFLVAGHETSTNMLARGLALLLENSDQYALVESDPGAIPNLVEEALRFDAPVQGMFRRAVRDGRVGDVEIPAGSMLMLLYGSANRDAATFADPDHFDVTRSNARANLSFGQGPHFCLGAPFARAEGRIGFETIFRRLRNIRPSPTADACDGPPSFMLRGLSSLPIEFDTSEYRSRRST